VIGFLKRIQDDRYRRAAKRRRTEELMGWICVPILVFLGWMALRTWDEMNVARGPTIPETIIPATTSIRRN
jgi:hypothetical protein